MNDPKPVTRFAVARHAVARTLGAIVALTLTMSLAPAAAQSSAAYPSRPINVIVPFAAGGSVDQAARLIIPRIAERLGQSMVIENVSGAGGTIGTQRAVAAKPDGYTLLFAVASPINVAPIVTPATVRYDALKDLAPIAIAAAAPFVLVGRADLPVEDTAALIHKIRSEPDRLTYGTDGIGTSMHLTAEMLKQQSKGSILHVPYRAGPQVLIELTGGQIDLAVMPVTLVQPFIRDGKVKAFGVTSRERWPSLPAVPALAETPALKDVDSESWYGLLAPARVDRAIIDRLARDTAAVLAEPALGERLLEMGMKPAATGPEDFARLLAAERASLQTVVRLAGIRIE